MNGLRILYITAYYKPAYVYGGPARCVPVLCEALAQAGADVSVFTTNANGQGDLDIPTDHPVNVDGVRVHYFQRSHLAPGRYFYAPDLGKACRKFIKHYDIVYICGDWTYTVLAAAKPALHAGIPYVICPHGSFMDWSMKQKRFKKIIYLTLIERRYVNRAAAIHCTSSLEKDQMDQWHFKPPVILIPNCINITQFKKHTQEGELRRKIGISPTAKVTLFVGRLHKMKRLDRIINLFSKISMEIHDCHLLIVGEDEDGSGEIARNLVSRLDLSQKVHFMGLLSGDDLFQAYADADLFILLSHRENFGMAAVEAMASGLPIIVSPEVGIAPDVKKYGAGYVVNTDMEAIKKWLLLLESTENRKRLSEAALNLAQNYSSQSVASKMIDSFRQVVCGKFTSY